MKTETDKKCIVFVFFKKPNCCIFKKIYDKSTLLNIDTLPSVTVSFVSLYNDSKTILLQSFNTKFLEMEGMKSQISSMLKGIERYNPENIKTLEHYVDLQVRLFVDLFDTPRISKLFK